jgi:Sulfotransferase domain
MTSPEAPLPTFLIIGAQKSATRWLRYNLGLHPEVYAADTEIQFFNDGKRFNELGPDWYRSQFEGWNGEPVVGEATPGYMIWRHRPAVVAPRIHEVVPDVRLIAILRNPVDRAHSAMLHHIAHEKLPKDADLLELVRSIPPERDPLGIVSGGWYAESLEPFLDVFGDQVLIVLHDDISADAGALYAQALAHVGATADATPADLDEVRFAYRQRRGVDASSAKTMTPDERRAMYEYFAADIAKLEKMLDRDLSGWNPG